MGLLRNRKFTMAIILMASLLIAIFTAEMLASRAAKPVALVSDVAAVLCASIAAAMYIWAWRKMSGQEVSRRVWSLVTAGIVLWTLAEGIWAFYEQILKIEIPYPSIADVFWLAGYIPLYAALLLRYRSFASSASKTQRQIVWLFMIVYSAIMALYVIKPMIDGFDSSRLAESATNIAYPVADWGLCALTLVIIFSLEHGRFATVWHLFGAGILLTATADLIFSYASWNEIYYPGGQLNFISGLLDGLFNISYLMLGLAVYTFVLLSEALPPPKINLVLKSLARMDVLVFVNPKGQILSLSDNFMNLVHAPATKPYIGMDLSKALGLDGSAAQDLPARILERSSLSNHPVIVKDVHGERKNAWLSSLTMINEEAQLDSIALVLRADPPPVGEKEFPLHQDQRMLIDYYLSKSGTSQVEENQALRAYFLAQINLLSSLLQQYNGSKVADKLLERLAQTARLNNWQFFYHGQEISIPDDFGGQSLRDLLLPLLQEARAFTADMTDERMVEQEMMSLDKDITPEALRMLDKYDFRLNRKPSASMATRSAIPATAD